MNQGSLQGEHVFNALGDLAEELAAALEAKINGEASLTRRTRAAEAVRRLRDDASALRRERNRGEFRTGTQGNPANAGRYSKFAADTRAAVGNIVSGNPSLHTKGYTDINRLRQFLDFHTIDEQARLSARTALAQPRRQLFDTWFGATKEQMGRTYSTLREAALEVSRTHLA